MTTVPADTKKPRNFLSPDKVWPAPEMFRFLVMKGRFSLSVMFCVRMIVSPAAALLMALASAPSVPTRILPASAGVASTRGPPSAAAMISRDVERSSLPCPIVE